MAPFREQESNVTTSNGWLAPGSSEAPSQPPSVTLMSSLPSEAWALEFHAVVVPQNLYHHYHWASQIPDSTNLKAMTPCELPRLIKSNSACAKWLQEKEESCPLCCCGKLTEMPHGKHSHWQP